MIRPYFWKAALSLEVLEETLTEEYGEPVRDQWLCPTWHIWGRGEGSGRSGLYLTKIGELYDEDAWSLVLVDECDHVTLLQHFPTNRKLDKFLNGMSQPGERYRFGRVGSPLPMKPDDELRAWAND